MTEQAKKALKESIEHWRRVAAGTMKPGESVGAQHCALCKEFNHGSKPYNYCDGCPVKDRTGKQGCVGSPFEPFEENLDWMDESEFSRWLATDEARTLAAAELAFLESLLPDSEK